ncbi:molybdopterin-dependent oxidoreductase [Rhodobacter sp. KR11]|uniref:molybdopterin-dependent oxidoreductase n=1 Tax=Rhodobacter sp. KR11 TaxID=2974588 RepID=UPI00222384CC|nr:molybdopterin cofactor-binding domain-containing protein [Rhodobacter sp. KR11]MCW1920293.1 molybdopterin-dependent oxidoreductase [Rhodobacter sp. KR11]
MDFILNGAPVSADPTPGERLSQTLRDRLSASEVKVGCNAGDCGACTVLVDGLPVCACITPAHQARGKRVDTVKGLLQTPEGQRLVASFQAHQAAQCGICTPGMMVAAVALLRAVPAPSVVQVQDALGGVLCRCTGYRKIIDAVMDATPAAIAPGGVGTAMARLDGLAKITGAEAYGDDVAPLGAWVVKVIRSPHARADFAFGDLQAVAALGLTVLTAADVPGRNAFGVIPAYVDQPIFAQRQTRFRGEAVAAIVGEAAVVAAFDPEDFPVDWTPLPALTSPAEALAPGAPLVHPDRAGNVMCRGRVRRGDVAAALETADIVVEGRFQTGFVEHAAIEPEAGFAQQVGGRLEIHACTQAPGMDLESMAEILGMDRADIRIVPTAVGGGFGTKLDLSVQPYVALAALKTGRPCRITYSRSCSMQSTTKRHPSAIHMQIGATRDGQLTAMRFDGDFDTGAYASWGPTVANRVPVHASGPYLVPHYLAETRAIHTNGPPSGAFRGFGVPQSAFALESLLEDLAARLGIDPLELRLRNALRNGDATVCGQVFDQGVGIGACLRALRPAYDLARVEIAALGAGGRFRRGVGVASGWYGCGNTSLPNPSTIRAGIRPDGALVLHQGAMDIGQGANTVIAQIFATALGAPVDCLVLIGPDTDLTPDAGKTSASRQTFVTGNAALRAGLALRAALTTRLNVAPDAALTFLPGQVRAGGQSLSLAALPPDRFGYALSTEQSYDPPTRPLDADGQGAPYAQFGYAAHLAVVEVDTALGLVRPLRFTAAHDVGRAINPLLVEGQVQGGIAQGLGMALMEEYIPGRTENLHDYLIPTIGDLPPIETLIIEEPDAHGPLGAKGLGEHVLIPTAPAIVNAIRDATGVALHRLPVTPARLRAALTEPRHD